MNKLRLFLLSPRILKTPHKELYDLRVTSVFIWGSYITNLPFVEEHEILNNDRMKF